MIRVILLSLGVSAVVSIAVFLLSKLKRPIYKYIPSMLLFLLALWYIMQAKHVTTSFGDLGNIVLALISALCSVMTFIVALLLKRKK